MHRPQLCLFPCVLSVFVCCLQKFCSFLQGYWKSVGAFSALFMHVQWFLVELYVVFDGGVILVHGYTLLREVGGWQGQFALPSALPA